VDPGLVADVFAAALPEGLDPDKVKRRRLIERHLLPMAYASIEAQWPAGQGPRVELRRVDWLITRDPAEAERFQPAHDCPTCLAANDQMRAFLAEHPDRWVVLANLFYREHWQ
jgi:hypothetical protein